MNDARPAALPADVATVLRDGPLHAALDLAIKRRGTSLEALQRRLAERGVHVGLSTLSYWRRGRRHPEGERSLRALHALEAVLGLPDESLAALTDTSPGRRARGRHPAPVGLDRAIGLTTERLATLAGIDLDANLRLDLLHTHYVIGIDADRAERRIAFSCAVSCRVDGADRYTIVYDARSDTGTPVIEQVASCRAGRIRAEPGHGVIAAEMRFDYPLRTGETYVFGFDISISGRPTQSAYFEHGLRVPCPQLLIEVQYDRAALPVGAYRYHRRGQEPAEATSAELRLGASATVHALTLDARPGVHGIRWDWE